MSLRFETYVGLKLSLFILDENLSFSLILVNLVRLVFANLVISIVSFILGCEVL